MRRTPSVRRPASGPRLSFRVFLGLERDDYLRMERAFRGPVPAAEEAASWRDAQAYKGAMERRITQTGTWEAS